MTQTAVFFDSYARDFDAIYGTKNTLINRVVNRFLRASMRLRYERTLALCAPVAGKIVLDVGAGPGHYSVELARRGARRVDGIDFAAGMIDIARERAKRSAVSDRCQFLLGDFMAHPFDEKYEYTVVMGFMDYVENPRAVVDRVAENTRSRAFFSFPASGGLLALQRKWRYRSRCPLYLYTEPELRKLFSGYQFRIEPMARDYFVTLELAPTQAGARS
jgi:2-polyprenyl-3-methyl-5-hydroxy-6-metoxy-1,4-benzoquinol methylase